MPKCTKSQRCASTTQDSCRVCDSDCDCGCSNRRRHRRSSTRPTQLAYNGIDDLFNVARQPFISTFAFDSRNTSTSTATIVGNRVASVAEGPGNLVASFRASRAGRLSKLFFGALFRPEILGVPPRTEVVVQILKAPAPVSPAAPVYVPTSVIATALLPSTVSAGTFLQANSGAAFADVQQGEYIMVAAYIASTTEFPEDVSVSIHAGVIFE